MGAQRSHSARESDTSLLVDVASAANSLQALQMIEDFIKRWGGKPVNPVLNLNVGELLLTQNLISKMRQLCSSWGFILETIYAVTPQTQQAALDEGLFVRERPSIPAFDPKSFMENFLLGEPETKGGNKSAVSSPRQDWKSAGKEALPPAKVHTQPPVASKHVVPPEDLIDLPFSNPQQEKSITSGKLESFMPDEEEDSFETVSSSSASYPGAFDRDTVKPPAESAGEYARTSSHHEVAKETLYIKQTVRSGRVVNFDGNIVIIGDVHTGSEIKATGDIAVWGELRGIAHAGAGGNYFAEIRALKIDALQLRIAEYIARRPDRIYYHKETAASSEITAEVAKVSDGEIKIFREVIGK